MNHLRALFFCSVVAAGSALAQTQAPLTGAMADSAAAYPVAAKAPAAAPASPPQAADQEPAPRQPYETYRLAKREVHPWPEVEGLPVQVQNERRYIPPFLDVGEGTRSLLSMQADSQRDGQELPVAGAAATLAWERYLNSFKHPIPEYMQERVKTSDKK